MEPELIRHTPFIDDLDAYYPGKADSMERRKCHDLLERTSRFVDEILGDYDPR